MKNWGPLTIALIAVVVSVYAVYLDNAHFDKALKQDQIREQKTDVQFGRAMSKAEEANELAGKATELAGEANKLTGEANDLAKEALAADDRHHEEAIELALSALEADTQNAEHSQLYDNLLLLHNRLTRQGDWLAGIPDYVRDAAQEYNNVASDNWREADKELMAGNFDLVRELIDAAIVNLEECYTTANTTAEEELPHFPLWVPEEEETYPY